MYAVSMTYAKIWIGLIAQKMGRSSIFFTYMFIKVFLILIFLNVFRLCV